MKKSLVILAAVVMAGCTSPWCVKMFGEPTWAGGSALAQTNPCLHYAMAEQQAGRADGMLWVSYVHASHAYAYKLHDGNVITWDINGRSATECDLEHGRWIGPKPSGIK